MKISIFFLFFIPAAFAITPDEIRTIAVERSPLISAQAMETRALRSEAELRGKWQNPQLMGQFGTLRTGSSMTGSTMEISLTQPVPISDKFFLRKEAAQLAASQAELQTEYFKNWVGQQAVLGAWRVHVCHELYKHGKERTRRLNLIKSYLETRPRVSVRHRVELSLLGTILLQLGREQDMKEHNLSLALDDLEFWTGKKFSADDIRFPIPELERLPGSMPVSVDENPDLKKLKLEARFATVDQEIARKERRPDVYLGGGYRVENVTPANHFMYGIVGLNVPIWDTGSSRLEAANARAMKSEKLLEEGRRQTDLRLKKQQELVSFALSQVRRFPGKLIHKTEDSIGEAERGFKQGILDVNTFIQSETQSHEVIDQVWLVWMQYLESLSDFALMQGKNFNWEKL